MNLTIDNDTLKENFGDYYQHLIIVACRNLSQLKHSKKSILIFAIEIVDRLFLKVYTEKTKFEGAKDAMDKLCTAVIKDCVDYLKIENILYSEPPEFTDCETEAVKGSLDSGNYVKVTNSDIIANALKSLENNELAKMMEFSIGDYSSKKAAKNN